MHSHTPAAGVSIVRHHSIRRSLSVAGEGKTKSKSGSKPLKRRSGPAPDVLRKGGPHKDRKRKTGREPIPRDELDDTSS